MAKTLYGLLMRFSSPEYVDSFVNDGMLYMNTVKYFREKKDNDPDLRGDRSEGRTWRMTGTGYLRVFEQKTGKKLINEKHNSAKVETGDSVIDQTNINCFTLITPWDLKEKNNKITLSKKFLKFGSQAAIITNDDIPIFFERLHNCLLTSPEVKDWAHKFIRYEGSFYSGNWGIFRKDDRYSWQYEWRVALSQTQNPGNHYLMNLGSLRDICKTISTEELIQTPITMSQV